MCCSCCRCGRAHSSMHSRIRAHSSMHSRMLSCVHICECLRACRNAFPDEVVCAYPIARARVDMLSRMRSCACVNAHRAGADVLGCRDREEVQGYGHSSRMIGPIGDGGKGSIDDFCVHTTSVRCRECTRALRCAARAGRVPAADHSVTPSTDRSQTHVPRRDRAHLYSCPPLKSIPCASGSESLWLIVQVDRRMYCGPRAPRRTPCTCGHRDGGGRGGGAATAHTCFQLSEPDSRP